MPARRSNPRTAKTVAEPDQKSRQKAEQAQKSAERVRESVESGDWPRNAAGKPMPRITMTAAEIIPTGQYANVSVGPAQIVAFVDPDAEITYDDDGKPHLFPPDELTVIAVGLNELAEIVEGDVVAVQRNLVLESLQEQVTSNGNS